MDSIVQIPAEIREHGRYRVLTSGNWAASPYDLSPTSFFDFNYSGVYILDVKARKKDVVVIIGKLRNGTRIRSSIVNFGDALQHKTFVQSGIQNRYTAQELAQMNSSLVWKTQCSDHIKVSVHASGVYALCQQERAFDFTCNRRAVRIRQPDKLEFAMQLSVLEADADGMVVVVVIGQLDRDGTFVRTPISKFQCVPETGEFAC